ncbi:hypothetical protein CRG98_018989 [Punica granatum]|uniref:Uncharacterized protein n=1 Tax=Punica granatum TaxID=22663 RepID=A0A2I0JWE0_PUNGR|nr:hypothetical protein CRG98_018989 [Punica granatum]
MSHAVAFPRLDGVAPPLEEISRARTSLCQGRPPAVFTLPPRQGEPWAQGRPTFLGEFNSPLIPLNRAKVPSRYQVLPSAQLSAPFHVVRACPHLAHAYTLDAPCACPSAPRAFPRTAAHAYPQPRKVHLCGPKSRSNHSRVGRADHRRSAMHWFTLPRELLSGLFPYAPTREGRDEEVPLSKPKTEMIEQTIHHQRDRLHQDRATSWCKSGLHHCKGSPPTTCNNKLRGKTHSASRAPILQGAPSTASNNTILVTHSLGQLCIFLFIDIRGNNLNSQRIRVS